MTDGAAPQEKSELDIIKETVAELRKEKEETIKLLSELKALEGQRIMGGVTKAGSTGEPAPVVEMTPKEYVKAVMSGKIKPQPKL